MNVVSELFKNPESLEDVRAVDFLESEVSAELVQSVRDAPSLLEAGELCERIREIMTESTTNYPAWIEDWLSRIPAMVQNSEQAPMSRLWRP